MSGAGDMLRALSGAHAARLQASGPRPAPATGGAEFATLLAEEAGKPVTPSESRRERVRPLTALV